MKCQSWYIRNDSQRLKISCLKLQGKSGRKHVDHSLAPNIPWQLWSLLTVESFSNSLSYMTSLALEMDPYINPPLLIIHEIARWRGRQKYVWFVLLFGTREWDLEQTLNKNVKLVEGSIIFLYRFFKHIHKLKNFEIWIKF